MKDNVIPSTGEVSAEQVRRLAAVHRALRPCADVGDLLARAAVLACTTCGFDRGLILTVGDGRLTAEDSDAIAGRESDLLRRRITAEPVAVRSGSAEAEVIRSHGARAARPSALADELGLEQFVIAAIVPDGWTVALLVLDRPQVPVEEPDVAVVELFAAMLAVQLERVVQRRRLADLSSEVQQFHAASGALVREALDGSVTLSSGGGSPVLRFDVAPGGAGTALRDLLSDAELRIAALLAQGRSNRQIAEELVISPETVKTHVARMLRKLGAANRAEAVYRLAQLGQAPPES